MGAGSESTSSGATVASARRSTQRRKLPSSWDDAPSSSKRARTTKEQAEKKPKKAKAAQQEKRLRRFRANPPQNFGVVYERATSQRFYVLGRSRSGTPSCPEESVELTGSTGNIYLVHIALQPTCTCPHAQKGSQCKHMLYVLSRVLRAPFSLVYQLALLSTELQDIFKNAPPIGAGDDSAGEQDGNRKAVEGDCPICFMPFEDADDIVYCRATCGQNIHTECFEMWAATKRRSTSDRQVTCPMCRTPWQGDDDMVSKIKNAGVAGREGYVNVANQLGITQQRDESTYYWGSRRRR